MSKKRNVSTLISAAGWISSLIGELVSAMKERGISDKQIHAFITARGKIPVGKIADEIVRAVKVTEYLKLISANESLLLSPTDGLELADIKLCFDSDFIDKVGLATPATAVAVYEMVKSASFAKMFGLLGDVQSLFFTLAQIKSFVKQYCNWLGNANEHSTFFALKSSGDFFVASITLNSPISAFYFDDPYTWDAKCRHRLVVPQM